MLARLHDGTPIRIRPISPDDKPLLEDGLEHLSDETIRRRFLAPKPRFTAADLRYLTEVDGTDHYALVAVHDDDPGELAGVGRWVRDAADPASAELAVVVADALQGQGLGTALGFALADAARERGVRELTATMLADNEPAHRLLAAITRRLQVRHDGPTDELSGELAA
ncbi:MAG TPA: GNAT family N-acetyltransferase [Solirubrobacteraceae bacterium]|nr:GNAT family N-acetyltransferase [Solirubrobacteraceae bacterium]